MPGVFYCRAAIPPAPRPVSAKPVPPVKPPSIAAATLPDVKFVDVTKEAGIAFVHANGASGAKLLPETMGSGAAFFDYDKDGDQDLLLVNSDFWPKDHTGARPTQALYRNDGKGHVEDVSQAVGLDKTFFGMGVAVGDYDNDGDPDLYFTTLYGGRLFRNDGGKFTDVTAEANAQAGESWLTSAAFFDMENDGDLDLLPGLLYRLVDGDRPEPGLPAHRDRQGSSLRAADGVQRLVLRPLAERRRQVQRRQRAVRHPRLHARAQGPDGQDARGRALRYRRRRAR